MTITLNLMMIWGYTMSNNQESEKVKIVKERLDAYYAAELKILSGQSYRLGSRELTRADLGTVKKQINELENQLESLLRAGGKRKVARIIPLDI